MQSYKVKIETIQDLRKQLIEKEIELQSVKEELGRLKVLFQTGKELREKFGNLPSAKSRVRGKRDCPTCGNSIPTACKRCSFCGRILREPKVRQSTVV